MIQAWRSLKLDHTYSKDPREWARRSVLLFLRIATVAAPGRYRRASSHSASTLRDVSTASQPGTGARQST